MGRRASPGDGTFVFTDDRRDFKNFYGLQDFRQYDFVKQPRHDPLIFNFHALALCPYHIEINIPTSVTTTLECRGGGRNATG
jgi:hypothetical protein